MFCFPFFIAPKHLGGFSDVLEDSGEDLGEDFVKKWKEIALEDISALSLDVVQKMSLGLACHEITVKGGGSE